MIVNRIQQWGMGVGFACALLSAGSAPAQAPVPAPEAISADAKRLVGQADRPTLPDQGETSAFKYSRSTRYDGTYEVVLPDSPEPVLVSDTFASLIANKSGMSDDQKRLILMSYPDMMTSMYQRDMMMNYPDHTQSYPDAFADTTLTGPSGTAVVRQDPSANPYVRVTLTDAQGQVQEFSMSRRGMENLLSGTATLDPDARLKALRTFEFKLPEQARAGFGSIPAEQLYEMASETPDMKRQEFVRMSKNIWAEEARQAELLGKPQLPKTIAAAAAAGTNAPAAGATSTRAQKFYAKLRAEHKAPGGTPAKGGAPTPVATAAAAPAAWTPNGILILVGALCLLGGIGLGYLCRRTNR